MTLIDLTIRYLNLSYTRCASLEDFLGRYAAAFDHVTTEMSSYLYTALDPQQLIADFTTMMNTDMSNRPQGAAPLFDAIFHPSYTSASESIKTQLQSYLENPRLSSEQVVSLYNEELSTIIPVSLTNQIPLLAETLKKNGIDPRQPPASEVFQQLQTISTDITTSQVCIDLKNYVLSIQIDDILAKKAG